MSDDPLDEKIRELIAKRFRLNPGAVTPATSLFKDLARDSLDIVETVMDLEREFQVTIDDADLEKLGNIGDLTDYIRAQRVERIKAGRDLTA